MESILSEVHQHVADVARRFSREKLLPRYIERERSEDRFDRNLLRQMGELGLIAPEVPEARGGLGLDCMASGLIAEEIGYGDFNIGYVPVLGSLMAQIIATYAQPHVANDWVRRITSGNAIVAIALTEPRGGSDAANLILRADKCDGGFILNGEKTSISAADQADAVVLFARTGSREQRGRGVSAFLADMGAKGVSRTRFDDLGSKIVGRGSIFFDDVFVPDDHLLGNENGGFVQIMQGFDYSRALLGLQCIGAAQASLDESWRYIQQREAFGEKLSAFQGVTFPLAEGETAMAAARQLCLHTLRLRDAGLPHTAEAAMCKWLGPKTSVDVIHQCLLTHGHYGWSKDMPHQQRLRDVMGIEIGDGTAQIMKMIISRVKCAEFA
jgi:cyclohexanecarboxyl-CoA dehydrogenase